MRFGHLAMLGLLIGSSGTAVFAQCAPPDLGHASLFGIGRVRARLSRYDFATERLTDLGPVSTSGGEGLSGIHAAAYIPGHQNLITMWTDPADHQARLLYVNTETARAAVVGQPLGPGVIRAATAVPLHDAASTCHFNGIDDYVEIAHSGEHLIDNGTIMFWFSADDVNRQQALFSKDSFGYDTGGHLHVYLKDRRLRVRLQGIASSHWLASATVLEPGRWYHAALGFGRSGMKLYLDGEVVAANAYDGGLGASCGDIGNYEPIALGASTVHSSDLVADNLRDFLAGSMSDLQIVARELRQDELVEFMRNGLRWVVFAQHSPYTLFLNGEVTGSINLNPSNSPHNEFRLEKSDGGAITRDDLHQNADVDEDGTLWCGATDSILVRPKGNGNQNDLVVNGQTYDLPNGTRHDLICKGAEVRVFNDHIHHNGKAMGHWWIAFTGASSVSISTPPDDEEEPKEWLVQVDHVTGDTTPIMPLDRGYDGLTTDDGTVFPATIDDQFYLIDTRTATETPVGPLPTPGLIGLQPVEEDVVGIDPETDQLVTIDPDTGTPVRLPVDSGLTEPSATAMMPIDQDPANRSESYD